MNRILRKSAVLAGFSGTILAVAPSCTKDLDRTPTYDLTTDAVYKNFAGYQAVAAKVYSGFAVTGPNGPDATSGDVQGIDQGSSDYIRQLWSAQELTTDEAVIQWGDPGVQDWHNMNWTSNGVFIQGLYSRILYEITLCNGFLIEATDAKIASRGLSATETQQVQAFRSEVRFLRALAYYHALDLYGNVPFPTEADQIGGTTPPRRITRADLFAYIETELKAIETTLVAPGQNQYGRADQGAAWMLLARLYLNAKTYTGVARYADCATYSKKVIDSNAYGLATRYTNLFRADNNRNATSSTGKPEIIFPIVYDGKLTQTYGGTTFLTHAAVSGTADANWKPSRYGIGGGWGGIRTTRRLYDLFPDTAADSRGKFQTAGQTLEIASQTVFANGYVPIKYRNLTSTGVAGSDPTFVDTDFPMFRLADAYLMYAEAALNGAGDQTLAVTYLNLVRRRAYSGSAAGDVSLASITSDPYFILNERARELHWEGTRRSDLIRFDRFVGNSVSATTYTWPWKGGVMAGTTVPAYRALFPIPSSDLSVNPNLTQNPGY
jgi:hypothetical protein